MIERLDDDVSYDRVMYHIEFMEEIESRLKQADVEPGIDHDELFERLLAEDAAQDKNHLGATRRSGSEANTGAHRAGRSKAGKPAGNSRADLRKLSHCLSACSRPCYDLGGLAWREATQPEVDSPE
jgi:hypothetical protein